MAPYRCLSIEFNTTCPCFGEIRIDTVKVMSIRCDAFRNNTFSECREITIFVRVYFIGMHPVYILLLHGVPIKGTPSFMEHRVYTRLIIENSIKLCRNTLSL